MVFESFIASYFHNKFLNVFILILYSYILPSYFVNILILTSKKYQLFCKFDKVVSILF